MSVWSRAGTPGEDPFAIAPRGASGQPALRLGADWLVALFIGAVGLCASLACSRLVAPRIIHPALDSVWFESDTWRKFANMTCRGSDQDRASVHPLFGLATVPMTEMISRVTGFSPLKSARALVALAAAAVGVAAYSVLRRLGCRTFDSALHALLIFASSAGVFWLGVPETYPFGALSMLLVVLVFAPAGRAAPAPLPVTASTIVAGGMTVTNELVAAIALVAAYPWRRALLLAGLSVAGILGLMAVQRLVIHSAPAVPLEHVSRELAYITPPTPGRAMQTIRALTLHSMVMPEIGARPARDPRDAPRRSIQTAAIRLAPLPLAALACWVFVLGVGTAAVLRGTVDRRVGWTLVAAVLGQFALHTVYGEEGFLYAAHVLPLLVLIAGCGTLTRLRPFVVGATALLLILAPLVNVPAFTQCVAGLPTP